MRKRTGYLIRRGKVFYAVWTVAGKKYMRTTGKRDRRKAATELGRIMEPFVAGDEVTTLQNIAARIEGRTAEITRLEDEHNPPLSLIPSWDAYLSAPGRPDSGPKTLCQYESHYDQFVSWIKKQHPDGILMRDVSQEMARSYAEHLTQRGLSANRFNKHIRFLELMFRVLKDKARVPLNPWENIRRKRQIPQGRRELTIDELRRVCTAAKGEMRLLLAIGIYTGLRLGDCATLRWGEVDLKRSIIRRIPNKTAIRNPKPIHIPIHSSLAAILNELPQEGRGDYVLPETAASYLRDPSIVTNNVRVHMEANKISVHKPGTGFETVIAADGKKKQVHSGTRACVEVGFHSLRHTFVSMCREANAPLSVVESMVGHSNPAMTRHYTHTSELAAASAVNSLPAVMGDMPALLPAKTRDEELREIIGAMTPKTCNKDKVRALALLNGPEKNQ